MLKLQITAVVVVLIITLLGLPAYYVVNKYTEQQATIIAITADNAKLTRALASSEEALAYLKADMKLIASVTETLNADFAKSRQLVIDLENRFVGHDLNTLAISDSKIIQDIVNKATADMFRCFEIASGAALTKKEINATKNSEINNQCPSIANPNYRAN